jgi:hypothetical protein
MEHGGPPALASALDGLDWIVAAENRPGAQTVYGLRPPSGARVGLLVGNEARGLRLPTLKRADAVVEIPVPSRNINCLNVAAAAAVILHYLATCDPLPFPQRTAAAVRKQRPGILLVGGSDAMELGSAIRSACAFGWEQVLLDDLGDAWYACDRRIKSEGRGSARRGRNPLRVVPWQESLLAGYRRLLVCTTDRGGQPLHRVPLTGPDMLVVLPDDSAGEWRPPPSCRATVTAVALPAVPPDAYHYRQAATIAMAEIARQLGRPGTDGIYLQCRRDRYRREATAPPGELGLRIEDLLCF